MAEQWTKGDWFICINGFGITISSDEAVVITNPGGRGHKVERLAVPRGARPYENQSMAFVVRLALEAVELAL